MNDVMRVSALISQTFVFSDTIFIKKPEEPFYTGQDRLRRCTLYTRKQRLQDLQIEDYYTFGFSLEMTLFKRQKAVRFSSHFLQLSSL